MKRLLIATLVLSLMATTTQAWNPPKIITMPGHKNEPGIGIPPPSAYAKCDLDEMRASAQARIWDMISDHVPYHYICATNYCGGEASVQICVENPDW